MHVNEDFIEVDGLKIRYMVSGLGDIAIVVVPQHNIPTRSLTDFMNNLSLDNVRVVALDMAGLRPSLSKSSRIKLMRTLINKVGVKHVLVGLGQGGLFILDYLTSGYYENLMGIVLVFTPRIMDYVDLLAKINRLTLLIYGVNDPLAPVEEASFVKNSLNACELAIIERDMVSELPRIGEVIKRWMLGIVKSQ